MSSKKSEKPKIEVFTKHREQNKNVIQKFENINKENIAKYINLCAYSFYLETYSHNTNFDIKEKAKPLTTCKNKFCANCTYLKSKKTFVDTYKVIEAIKNRNIAFIAFHLTLTVKNPKVEDFEKTLNTMNKALVLMFKKNSKYKFKNYVLGYQASRETTQSSDAKQRNELHPHIHVLLLLKQEFYNEKNRSYKLTQDAILSEWNACLKHYDQHFPESTQIAFKRIKNDKNNDLNIELNAIAEVSKYPVKISDITNMSDADFKVLDDVLYNKRLMTFGGIIKQVRAELKINESVEDAILYENEYTLLTVNLYKVNNKTQKYKKIEVNDMRFIYKLNYYLLTKKDFFDAKAEIAKQQKNLDRLNFESIVKAFKEDCYKKAKSENKKIEYFDENHCPVFYEDGKYIPHLNYLHDIEDYL